LVFTDEFGEPLTGSRITERRLCDLCWARRAAAHPLPRPAPHGRHDDAERTFEGTNEGTADSAATEKPRFTLKIGA
jgi:hypothetical protein